MSARSALTLFSFVLCSIPLRAEVDARAMWFSGFRTSPITIPSGVHSEMVVVTFRRGKAYPFLHEPLDVLRDAVVDAELVMPRPLRGVREQMRNEPDPGKKLLLLEKGFEHLFAGRLKANLFVEFMVSRLTTHRTHVRLVSLAREIGYTHKHMISTFRQHVGVTLKTFVRIMRFQKAVNEIGLSGGIDWGSLAYDCGFYDQSHLASEFRRFSGFSPSEYIRRRGDLLNYLPVAGER